MDATLALAGGADAGATLAGGADAGATLGATALRTAVGAAATGTGWATGTGLAAAFFAFCDLIVSSAPMGHRAKVAAAKGGQLSLVPEPLS